jgi:diguanylate cyclase (GGDEF)-like protein/PAS domain S-box-containing protein
MFRKTCIHAFLVSLIVLACLGGAPLRSLAVGGGTYRVLYINSYHSGFQWSDDIEKNIRERLIASNGNIDMSVEYLDSRRFPDPALQERLAAGLAAKYARYRHDLVIVSDDAALNFALTHRQRLFPSLPIVFCGYNYFRPAVLRGAANVTGVNEEVDVSATVDLALRMHPATRTLLFIVSTRETSSIRNTEQVEATVVPRYRGRYRLMVLKNAALGEMRERLAKLPRKSLVFLIGWASETGQGPLISPMENARLVATASPVPVYTPWEFCLGSGVVGGHVLSGADQGGAAAELALRILGGEAADRIPVVMTSPARVVFDRRAMERFSLKESSLPSGSLVINRPESAWWRYRREIIGVTLLLAVETVLIAALLTMMRQRRHALDALARERELLEERVAERTRELYEQRLQLEESLLTRNTLLNNALVTIALVRERRLVWVSSHVIDMLGYSPAEVIGHTTEFLYADPGDYARITAEAPVVLARGDSYLGDYCYRRKDGTRLWCTISIRAFDPADLSRGVLFVAVDIDERKRMEHDLQEANARLEMLATTDPLTGLANRRQLMAAMDREISRSDRYGHPFSVILMDVDFFKSFNDSFGHDAGDSVLLQMAAILREHSRKSDMAGRWGGEEFLMLCPETDMESTAHLAELFRSRISEHNFNLPVLVTASFGVQQYRQGSDVAAVVKGADEALYRAKTDGRNCVRRAG